MRAINFNSGIDLPFLTVGINYKIIHILNQIEEKIEIDGLELALYLKQLLVDIKAYYRTANIFFFKSLPEETANQVFSQFLQFLIIYSIRHIKSRNYLNSLLGSILNQFKKQIFNKITIQSTVILWIDPISSDSALIAIASESIDSTIFDFFLSLLSDATNNEAVSDPWVHNEFSQYLLNKNSSGINALEATWLHDAIWYKTSNFINSLARDKLINFVEEVYAEKDKVLFENFLLEIDYNAFLTRAITEHNQYLAHYIIQFATTHSKKKPMKFKLFVSKQDSQGFTLLHHAINHEEKEIVQYLLKTVEVVGMDLNKSLENECYFSLLTLTNSEDTNALILAIKKEQLDVIYLLHQYTINLCKKNIAYCTIFLKKFLLQQDKQGYTFFSSAIETQKSKIFEACLEILSTYFSLKLLDNRTFLTELLKIQTNKKLTVFHLLIKSKKNKLLSMLLEYIDVNLGINSTENASRYAHKKFWPSCPQNLFASRDLS